MKESRGGVVPGLGGFGRIRWSFTPCGVEWWGIGLRRGWGRVGVVGDEFEAPAARQLCEVNKEDGGATHTY